MLFYNLYFENEEWINGQLTKCSVVDKHSYIDFGDGRVSSLVRSDLQKIKENAEKEQNKTDLVIKESREGDCISIHVICINKYDNDLLKQMAHSIVWG